VTLSTTNVIAATGMSGTVNFSMGCHSGLSVHDEHARGSGSEPLDFAQALAQKGGWWIGNTGYGYGMDDSVALSERLTYLFAQKLSDESNMPVGEALRWAKNRYLGSVPSGGFGTYDEKALIEATLYGLPMYRVSVPSPGISSLEVSRAQAGLLFSTGSPTGTVTFDPADLECEFHTVTRHGDVVGTYCSIGGEVQASPGRPVQPRTSAPIPPKAELTPHGAVLISATSVLIEGFNPLISRPVTDTVLSEPPFEIEAEAWFPANTWAVNRLGDDPRLVVVPAQFQGDRDSGKLRRFTALEFEVYYTDTASIDFSPPIVWTVEGSALGAEADFQVDAEDTSGIQRVVMAYTQDGSQWQIRDLDYAPLQDRWERHFTGLADQFIYFVQVVDGAGNVTVTSNKGLFFEPTRHQLYLPLVMRDYS
jgi:hypothetical protein